MIFISHTHVDKVIVEPIAIKLGEIFGNDKVFYDSWSIQPGDGIIDMMNSGLENCKYFFFFVSKNSLQSKMVSLEWQNALLKSTKGDVKIIPVKLDDCLMPAILLQSLYIDVFGQGLDVAVRQMIDVINGNNTFRPTSQQFHNVRGKVTVVSDSEYIIEFTATYYLEPISNYAIVVGNNLDDIVIKCLSDGVRTTSRQSGAVFTNEEIHNILYEGVSRGTTPSFPYRVKVTSKSNDKIKLVGLMHAKNEDFYEMIPYSIN